MRNILIRLFINTAAIWLIDKLFDDIWIHNSTALIITALVFGLLNTFIKPILIIFTLPINILTLGLFTIIINALILLLTDFFVDSFYVATFSSAILASIFISLISIILNKILIENNGVRR